MIGVQGRVVGSGRRKIFILLVVGIVAGGACAPRYGIAPTRYRAAPPRGAAHDPRCLQRVGSAGSDRQVGTACDDRFFAGAGDDTLVPGTGGGQADGGPGTDTLVVDAGRWVYDEVAGGWRDAHGGAAIRVEAIERVLDTDGRQIWP